MKKRPGDLVTSREFMTNTQALFGSYRCSVDPFDAVGTLHSNELCVVIAVKPTTKDDRVFVLTQCGELGWKHHDDFFHVSEPSV